MNRQIILLDQIIEMAGQQEEELKKYYISIHKASKTLGDSALLFHLKALKDLIIEESKSVTPVTPVTTVVLDGKTYQVAVGNYPTGCISEKYCHYCKIIYRSSICVCNLQTCQKCKCPISIGRPVEMTGWTKVEC